MRLQGADFALLSDIRSDLRGVSETPGAQSLSGTTLTPLFTTGTIKNYFILTGELEHRGWILRAMPVKEFEFWLGIVRIM